MVFDHKQKQKGAYWAVFPFLASLEPKKNTFFKNQNADYNWNT